MIFTRNIPQLNITFTYCHSQQYYKSHWVLTIIAIVKQEDSYRKFYWVERNLRRSLSCNALLSCLHAIDRAWTRRYSKGGIIVRASSKYQHHLRVKALTMQFQTITRKHENTISRTLPLLANSLLTSSVIIRESMQALGLALFLTSKPWHDFVCKHDEYNKMNIALSLCWMSGLL